ncbi:Serine threonine- kinase mph1 [Lecanosticta acicola]|uniref:Serine threonine- kinase mph1 n=1 Tax=Lecanosticta acicola TaxID=111012 RepID=A0AAI8Z059_9PEZI|nr:Serine threonine- kinase mph1 [Lecanosticta acicola]
MIKSINVGDDSDSDDEPPPAIKFSKVTQALLADEAVISSPPRQEKSSAPRFHRSVDADKPELDTPSRASGIRIVRRNSPSAQDGQALAERGNTPPRVVHLGGSKGTGSAKRSISISGPYPQRTAGRRGPTPETHPKSEVVTPAQPRAIRVVTRSRAGSNASQDDRSHLASSISRPASRNGMRATGDSNDRNAQPTELSCSTSQYQFQDNASRYGASTATRSRNPSAEAGHAPGSQRIKRAPIGTGTFLKSGPVRRGFRRRDSEENVSPNEDLPNAAGSSQQSGSSYTPQERSFSQMDDARSRSGSVNTRATSVEPVSVHDFAQKQQESRPGSRQAQAHVSRSQANYESRPHSHQTSREPSRGRQASIERYQSRRQNSVPPADLPAAEAAIPQQRRTSIEPLHQKPVLEQKHAQISSSYNRANYRYVGPKVHTDSAEDQENMPPPTFRRNRDQEFKYLGKPSVLSDDEKSKVKPRMVDETPVPVPQQEQRKPLGAISGNTPHRPAPAPPPKMSVLDAATATAGASTAKTRKKRSHMVVNGKIFTSMGRIGKGGTSDVYCVMAENQKTFALKRINDEKQELIVLMEKGDTDFNRILTLRLNGVEAKFDSAFARYHWKEMLECVQAVHEKDIVHSDLKPANFVLVQGRLKLIDFGIANAIDTDNTCNVHRDSHVGTPNYMSPESITDTNASSGTGKDEAGRPLKKDMRIGKSSDVWSLGCILYQMVYGRPPFAHIPNQISRIMAITNPKHTIEFPEKGVGDVKVPLNLISTLRKCLNRNPDKRPTIKQLLADSDPYINPEGPAGENVLMSEDLLGLVINKVLERCRDPKRGIPGPEEAAVYPRSFMARIREMQEGR